VEDMTRHLRGTSECIWEPHERSSCFVWIASTFLPDYAASDYIKQITSTLNNAS